MDTTMTLEQQRAAFNSHRFLAMPLSGAICWGIVGLVSPFLNGFQASWLLFIAIGSIFYLATFINKLTGESFFRPEKNAFDRLFFAGLIQANLAWALAIPYFIEDHRSITLTVGILSGTMWMPFSWIIQHWIGYFHAIVRTVLIVAGWYLFPEHHFQAVPAVIVGLYVVTIAVLESRWRAQTRRQDPSSTTALRL